MGWISRLATGARALSQKRRLEAEMREELAQHLDLQTRQNLEAGMSPAEARREARKRFGAAEKIHEECREAWGVAWVESLGRDIRLAGRTLRKNPVFTLVAIVTLGLGIGANTAIFSLVDQLLARPLPVPNPSQLAVLANMGRDGNQQFHFHYPLFKRFQRENSVFTELACTGETPVGLSAGSATERLRAQVVSGNYFRMLGIQPALGRFFAESEGVEIDDAQVLVLGHGLWQRRFGGDPGVVGRKVLLNGHPFQIIGVAPREFAGTTRVLVPDLYAPITTQGMLNSERPGGEHPLNTPFYTWITFMGRLKPGTTHEQATAALRLLAERAREANPANVPENLAALPGARGFTVELQSARLPLMLLMAVSALVLLIACANLANLQLARATGRAREFAIRLALGAGRARLIRQLLTESLLLSCAGGLLGILLAAWVVQFLDTFRPADASLVLKTDLNPRVLLFTLLVAGATALLFGLAPAWRASRPDLLPELKGADTAGAGSLRWSLRPLLVVAQVALSLVVLVSASLCVRSLAKLEKLDAGFEPSRVLMLSLNLGLNQYSTNQSRQFYDRLLARARALPGVESVALGANTPLSGSMWSMTVERVEGHEPPNNQNPMAGVNFITPDYFRTLGVALRRGRDFTPADDASAPRVLLVNEAFAARYFAGQNPLGKRVFQHGPDGGVPTEVVGVVATTAGRNLENGPVPMMYFPLAQRHEDDLTLLVRAAAEPSSLATAVAGISRELDPNVPVFKIRTMDQQKSASLAMQRMAAVLLSAFGVVALSLASMGVYGVLAYSVNRRTHEIGIRMALGAGCSDVLRMVLRQGMRHVLAGLGLGLLGAMATARAMAGFLHGVGQFDPVAFGLMVAVMAAVSALACWLPARRAALVQPMVALRHD